MTRWMLIAALSLPLTACGGEEPADEPHEVIDETANAPLEEEVDEPTAAEVPIAEDFEDEAETAITADNYASVLDELEAEIDADGE